MASAFEGLASVAQGYLNAEQTLRDRFESDREHNLKQDALNEQVRQFDNRQSEIVRQFDMSFEQGVREFDQRLAQQEDHFTRGQEWQGEQNELNRSTQVQINEANQAAANWRQKQQLEARQKENALKLRANEQYLNLLDNLGAEPFDTVSRGGEAQAVDISNPQSVADYLQSIQLTHRIEKKKNAQGVLVDTPVLALDNATRQAIASWIYKIENGQATGRQALQGVNTWLVHAGMSPNEISPNETLIAQYEQVAMMSTTGDWESWNSLSQEDRAQHIARLRGDRTNLPALRAQQLRRKQDEALAVAVTQDPNMAALWMDKGLQTQGSNGVIFGSYRNEPVLIPGSMVDLSAPIQTQINNNWQSMMSLWGNSGQITDDPEMWDINPGAKQYYQNYVESMTQMGRSIDAALPPGDWRTGVGARLARYYIDSTSKVNPQTPLWVVSARQPDTPTTPASPASPANIAPTTPLPGSNLGPMGGLTGPQPGLMVPGIQNAPSAPPAQFDVPGGQTAPALNAPAVQGAAPAPAETPVADQPGNNQDIFIQEFGMGARQDLLNYRKSDYIPIHGQAAWDRAVALGVVRE